MTRRSTGHSDESVCDDESMSDSGYDVPLGPGGYLSEELPVTPHHRETKRVLNLPSDRDSYRRSPENRFHRGEARL